MKRIIFKYQFWVLLFLLGVISCESDDNFLKENPTTFYTTDNAFSTSAQVDQVLVSGYSQLRDLWANPNEEGWIFVFRGNGTDMFDVASIRRAGTFNNYGNINPDNATFYNVYSTWYQLIAKANLALYASELPQISWASQTEKAYAVAQARFFRAFAYRNLAELFGGVPIVTEISKTPRYDFKRSTHVETYQFAIDELLAIESDLPETTVSGGRVVKGAAQHNLCELYLSLGTQLVADGKSSEARTRANCGYLVTTADMDDSFNLILDERARELVYEECRWNTLLRMGGTIAVDRIKKYAYWPEAQATLTFNYNLWPIPQTIIDTNKDVKLEQNDGWNR